MADMEERVLPHNLDAEKSVIGGIMLRNEMMVDAADIVVAEDFYRQAHRRIFTREHGLWKAGQPIDLITLTDALSRHGELDEVGGPAYIAKMVDGVPRSTDVADYAKIVKQKATLRALILAAKATAEDAYDGAEEAVDIAARGESQMRTLGQTVVQVDFVDGRALARAIYDRIEQNAKSADGITGLPTGFYELDQMTAGLRPGNLIYLAARPGMGKSAMAGQIFYHVGVRLRRPAAFFALEMSRDEIGVRLACSAGAISHMRADRGWLNPSEFESLQRVLVEIEESRSYLDDGMTVRPEDIRRKCRWLQAQHGDFAVLVVDYIQLMDPPATVRKSDNQTQILGAISRELKRIAKELQCPVIALSQLNRKCEERQDKRPMMSDLRESGALEQDADGVWFLYRDEVYNKGPEHDNVGKAELIIAKQRNGPLGTVHLAWQGDHVRFESQVAS